MIVMPFYTLFPKPLCMRYCQYISVTGCDLMKRHYKRLRLGAATRTAFFEFCEHLHVYCKGMLSTPKY